MATITKRGRGYRVQVRLHGRRPKSKTFRTHALAIRWAREVEHALERAELPSEADLGALTRKYRLEVYGATARPRAGLKHYERLERDLAGVRVAEITAQWWLEWARKLEVKPASRMRYFTEIVSVLKTAEALWDTAVPWRAVSAGRVLLERHGLIGHGRHRDRRVTDAELDAIKAQTGKCVLPINDIIDLAVLTGLRQAEFTRITWDDLDEPRRIILVRDRKHPRLKFGNHGEVPLLGDAFDIVKRQPKVDDEPRIFPWKSPSIGDAFDRAAARAKVRGIRFHDLRHEAASRLIEAGFSIPETALVTGHRDWNTLRRYTHLRPDDLHDGPASRRKDGPAGEAGPNTHPQRDREKPAEGER